MPPPPPPPPPLPYARTAGEVELQDAGIPRAFRRAMMSVPSSPTVGEETGLPRPAVWVVAIVLPCLVLGYSAALTYCFCQDQPALAASAPWRPLAIVLGGVPPALITVVFGRMHLFLPRAPFALLEALVNVGMCCLGLPLWVAAILVAGLGCTWMFIALACLVAMLTAGVTAFWVCLARVYG
ncbi:hypothetical protein BAE44_0017113 [Dichanthelium oligosanthes]|uniref:DUF7378 domain-containing protein n=1 Tax=Dichanthelium oligosanthes TaxID=888268 RepID=A0A1E5V9X4_9POAL|nr:hypothetical protein BAE44_0017113 [Dichanthelium oligosanthes]